MKTYKLSIGDKYGIDRVVTVTAANASSARSQAQLGEQELVWSCEEV